MPKGSGNALSAGGEQRKVRFLTSMHSRSRLSPAALVVKVTRTIPAQGIPRSQSRTPDERKGLAGAVAANHLSFIQQSRAGRRHGAAHPFDARADEQAKPRRWEEDLAQAVGWRSSFAASPAHSTTCILKGHKSRGIIMGSLSEAESLQSIPAHIYSLHILR